MTGGRAHGGPEPNGTPASPEVFTVGFAIGNDAKEATMPGFEWFGEEERTEVQKVLETGVLMRYGFDAARKGNWDGAFIWMSDETRIPPLKARAMNRNGKAMKFSLCPYGFGFGPSGCPAGDDT